MLNIQGKNKLYQEANERSRDSDALDFNTLLFTAQLK